MEFTELHERKERRNGSSSLRVTPGRNGTNDVVTPLVVTLHRSGVNVEDR